MPIYSLLILIIIKISGEYKLWSLSLCNYFHPPATFCLKYLWGCVIPWVRNLAEGKKYFYFQRLFRFPSCVENRTWFWWSQCMMRRPKMYFRHNISCLLRSDIPTLTPFSDTLSPCSSQSAYTHNTDRHNTNRVSNSRHRVPAAYTARPKRWYLYNNSH